MNSIVGRGHSESIFTATYARGDVVAAVRDVGMRSWRSGVPAGSVGTVVDIDWLGDLRVVFVLDGDWFGGRTDVEQIIATSDVRLITRAERRRRS